jgi:hypothetical protein
MAEKNNFVGQFELDRVQIGGMSKEFRFGEPKNEAIE